MGQMGQILAHPPVENSVLQRTPTLLSVGCRPGAGHTILCGVAVHLIRGRVVLQGVAHGRQSGGHLQHHLAEPVSRSVVHGVLFVAHGQHQARGWEERPHYTAPCQRSPTVMLPKATSRKKESNAL